MSFALVVTSACTKTETVPFEIVFPGEPGEYRFDVYVAQDCLTTELPEPTRVRATDSLPDLSVEEGQVVIVIATDSMCNHLRGCASFTEDQALTVTLAPFAFTCGRNECCDGFCAENCETFDADFPPSDAGSDGVLADTDAGPIECESLPISQVSVGEGFSCALTESDDGGVEAAVYCWGGNDLGQVTPGAMSDPLPPTRVDVPGTVSKIQAGAEHACALTSAGAVYCWGFNDTGTGNRLGTDGGTNLYRTIAANAADLSVGGWHSCAVMTNRSVRCWGTNESGELGRTNRMNLQDNVVGGTAPGFTQATQVLSGFGNSCAFPGNAGGLWCWGYDGNGAVGQPAANPNEAWVHREVFLPDTSITTVRAFAASHTRSPRLCSNQNNIFGGTTCGAFGDSSGTTQLYCWGSGRCGQVGDGTERQRFTPQPVNAVLFPPASRDWVLGVGGGTVCAASRVTDEGARPLYCWGDAAGEKLLGSSQINNANRAMLVMDDVSDVSVGTEHICTVSSGRVYCWGNNANGKVRAGGATSIDRPICVPIPAL